MMKYTIKLFSTINNKPFNEAQVIQVLVSPEVSKLNHSLTHLLPMHPFSTHSSSMINTAANKVTTKYKKQCQMSQLLRKRTSETNYRYLASTTHNSPTFQYFLALSCQRPLSYRNQSSDLQNKSMDWFLYETASITKELSKIEIAETIK